jgi:hypothetical protein
MGVKLKTTRYFREQVMTKRPHLKYHWIEAVLANPEACAAEENGRIRHWGHVAELGKYLRVITLADGETVHNAFPDRSCKGTRES